MSEQKNAEALRALSDVDLGVLRLQKQLDELPQKQQILGLRQKIKEIQTKAAQIEKMAHDTARTLSFLADEAQLNDEQLAQSQAALNKSKEYRETSNLVAEMEMLANRKAKLEEDSLIQMEKQDKIAAVGAQVSEAAQKLEAENQALTDAYRKAGGKLKQDLHGLEQVREALVATLPENMALTYRKALKAKAGIGATHLIGNRCSGCFVTLSEGQLAKLLEGPLVGACPNCNRMIATVEGD
ncbi:MAG: hypothetical protein FWD27_08975 [Coriobacteriia bacterium]|nr:hypothetical protein [Coriobacteriia bacterium]